MTCTNPFRIIKNLDRSIYPDGLEVPCGKCLACRIKKRTEWAMRMQHELDSYERSSFVTLTYQDKNVPENMSLRKDHLQKFFKRLRKSLQKQDRKIRYFACGEYGDKTERPHYHAIIFGLGLQKEDKQLIIDSWNYTDWSVPVIKQKAFGLVEFESIQYVAQYIDKKLTGDLAEKEYYEKGREPVFRIMSLGIGKKWMYDNADQLRSNLHTSIRGKKMSLPRYYLDKLNIDPILIKQHAIEKQHDLVEHYTGISDLTVDEAYRVLNHRVVNQMNERIKEAKLAHHRTLSAKVALKKTKL